MIRSNHAIPWFSQWLSTYDLSRGRIVVHLPAAGGRLHQLKPLILAMVDMCERNRIAIEFHVTSGDGRRTAEEEDAGYFSDISVYGIDAFFVIERSANLHCYSSPMHKYAHRIIVRRTDVLAIDDIDDLSKVDIILFSLSPERGLQTGGRWDRNILDAINQELNENGLVIRTCNDRNMSPLFTMLTSPKIQIGTPYNWYDVWQRKEHDK